MAFITPVRRVVTQEDLDKWTISKTYEDLAGFVSDLADSVRGKANDECEMTKVSQSLLNVLDKVVKIVHGHPVKDKSTSRFGKPEFKDVYDEIYKSSKDILHSDIKALDSFDKDNDPIIELSTYFCESWGNRTRIDYGSGHELNFLAFLLCLKKLHIIKPDDYEAIILKVFNKYISVMRILQKEYWLEPAGSHGVWGLDDYHFLPFLFGASQLATHKHLRPKSIHSKDMVELFHTKYMYFECIYFINSIKTASLRWHSPMIDDISGVKTWSKVAEGMQKMFKAEVLGKLPIIQHFFFGSILKAPEGCTPARQIRDESEPDHDHDSDEGLPIHRHTWGDCCGIKVPSAIAAAEMNKTKKPLPFD